MYSITFRAIAVEEYEQAINWYASKSRQAIENYIKEVNDKLDNIGRYPKRYKKLYKHYYEASLRKYPYTIVYFIEEDLKQIIIVAVYHHKRNPKKKYRR